MEMSPVFVRIKLEATASVYPPSAAFFRAVIYIVAVDPAEDKPRSLTKYITFDALVAVEKYPLLVSDNKYEQPDIAPQDNVVLL